jgi:CheY-like chemotaxis protein
MLVSLLPQWGAQVRAVASATEALQALKADVPDVLISDVGLPDLDGFELMRKVRELPPQLGGRVSSLALTAYATSDDVAKAQAAGFDQHLGKPVQPSELLTAVASLAGRPLGR